MNSDVVALWFGTELYLASPGEELRFVELPDRGDEIATVARAIEASEPRPRRVRLLYHPADLEHHAVECVKGSRVVVRNTLSDDHPALRNPGAVWAVSRLAATETGYATLLWIDPKPRLARLRDLLRQRGISVVGVWPLVSVFELSVTAEATDTAVLGLFMTDSGGLVYAAAPGGGRTVVWSMGAEYRSQLGGLVRNTLSRFDPAHPPAAIVIDTSEKPWDLGVSPIAELERVSLPLGHALEQALQLDPRGLDNFLPPQRELNLSALVLAASLICAVGAAFSAVRYVNETRRLKNDSTVRQHAAEQLQASNAKLAANRQTIDRLAALRNEMRYEAAGRFELVERAVKQKPPEVTLHGITISGSSFEITGTAHEGVGQSRGPFYDFVDALTAKPARWQITPESRPSALPTSSFTIAGSFQ